MQRDKLDELEEVLGYRFRDRSLLEQALTHSSRKTDLRCSNERMEFLGDAILGGAVSEYLYRKFPDFAEGDLTRAKSAVVSRACLARAAREMNLGRYLLVAKGVALTAPEGGGSEEAGSGPDAKASLPPSLLANGFEAIIAAVYLDSGIRAAYRFVLRHVQEQVERACKSLAAQNFKSALQEFSQREIGATPAYEVTAEMGPDHVKVFEVVTVIAGKKYETGRGRTKKEAEQMAAELTLGMLKGEATVPEGA